MKELSIEQKAIAYDEAIERAKKWYNAPNSDKIPTYATRVIEEIFHEFCESEDERMVKFIKKQLFNIKKTITENYELDAKLTKAIDWLEKQGNQKLPIEKLPSEMKTIGESLGFTTQKEYDEYNKMVSVLIMSEGKDKPKFKVGDWVVVSTTKGDRVVQVASVEYLKDGYPSYTTTEGRWFGNGTKARLLTDKDVETITLPESKIIVKQKHAKWSEEELTDFEKSLKHVMEETLECGDIHNLKADAELLLNLIQKPSDEDMKEALRTEYEKGRADAFAEMQKEWSEEDEKMALGIEQIVNCASLLNIAPDKLDKVRNWLKFLKDRVQPQSTWKPSDEQIVVLELASKYERVFTPKQINILIGLKEQLKKLKG